MSETIYEIEKLNTLIKCNPYYFDKYFIIVDNLAAIEDEKLKNRFEKIRANIKRRFIELKLHSLEDYYSNLDVQIEKDAKKEIEKNKNDQGTIKARYAKIVSEKITDKYSFSKFFNSELDFLIQ